MSSHIAISLVAAPVQQQSLSLPDFDKAYAGLTILELVDASDEHENDVKQYFRSFFDALAAIKSASASHIGPLLIDFKTRPWSISHDELRRWRDNAKNGADIAAFYARLFLYHLKSIPKPSQKFVYLVRDVINEQLDSKRRPKAVRNIPDTIQYCFEALCIRLGIDTTSSAAAAPSIASTQMGQAMAVVPVLFDPRQAGQTPLALGIERAPLPPGLRRIIVRHMFKHIYPTPIFYVQFENFSDSDILNVQQYLSASFSFGGTVVAQAGNARIQPAGNGCLIEMSQVDNITSDCIAVLRCSVPGCVIVQETTEFMACVPGQCADAACLHPLCYRRV